MPETYTPYEQFESGVWAPRDAVATIEKPANASVVIDNRTDLADEELISFFEDNTAMFGFGEEARYTSYANEGTMMARAKWIAPRNVIEEIRLARDFAERDDDVGATMGAIMAAAYSEGYQNQHEDEQVEHTFEKMSESIGLRGVLHELHRELLISSQINSVTLFTRETYNIRPENVSRVISRSVAAPMIGVLPAEHVRVLGNDIFGNGQLAYVPHGALAEWLRSFWNASPAKQREMRLEDPIAAALFTGPVMVPWNETDLLSTGMVLYKLNPAMVNRSTFAKGSWRYPRPLLTRDFALLEAKRLLNVMDHALLQGGTNFIVVAKKGSDQKPATPNEIMNLREVVKRASRAGVLIGDHRISLEVITPNLTELLNPTKRQMLGKKISGALLRVPELGNDDTGSAMETFTELAQRVIADDRALVINHIQQYIWTACMKRNAAVFGRDDRPLLWTPKIILQGMQFWNDYLLKLYDRGDLPRKYMVEFGGYNYDATKAQKQREMDNDHDAIFSPPAVPFSSPNQQNSPTADPNDPYKFGVPNSGAPDNGPGRPKGTLSKPGQTKTPARPKRTIRQTPGETVKAVWNEEEDLVVRIGEITEMIIAEFPNATLGRLTAAESAALDRHETHNQGNLIVIPVNQGTRIVDVSAVRLEDGMSLLCGNRVPDGAVMAAAICFREPKFTLHEAEDMAIRWGYPVALVQADDVEPDSTLVTCPQCDTEQPVTEMCVNCGFTGEPFVTFGPLNAAVSPLEVHVHFDHKELVTIPAPVPPKEEPKEE
jgi:hypothetical protein